MTSVPSLAGRWQRVAGALALVASAISPALAADGEWQGSINCADRWGNPINFPTKVVATGKEAGITVGSINLRKQIDKDAFSFGISVGQQSQTAHLRGTISGQSIVLKYDGGDAQCSGTLASVAPAAPSPTPAPVVAPAPAQAATAAATVPAEPAPPPTSAMVEMAAEIISPPKTRIEDVVAMLKTAGDRSVAESARVLLEAPEPTDKPDEERADFFARRGFAALALDRTAQAVDDFRKAYDIARVGNALPILDRTWYQYHLGVALFRAGELGRAIGEIKTSIADLRPAADRGGTAALRMLWHLTIWEGFLAATHVATGDLPAAEQSLARTEAGFAALRANPTVVAPHEINILEAAVAHARAVTADLRGRPAEADPEHRKAIAALAAYRSWPEGRWTPRILLEQLRLEVLLGRAGSLVLAGRTVEAEALARQIIAESVATKDGPNAQLIEAAHSLAEALLGDGRARDAAAVSALALSVLERAGGARDSALRIRLGLTTALSHAARHDWPASLATFDALRRDLGNVRFDQAMRGDPTYAAALLKDGRKPAALAAATTAVSRARQLYGERHLVTAEAVAVRGAALAAAGKSSEASAAFRAAMPLLIDARGSGDTAGGGSRTAQFRIAVDYLLAGSMAGESARQFDGPALATADDMFRAAEAARTRTLLDAMAAAAARSGLRDAALTELVRREQDASRRIRALYESLAGWYGLPPTQRTAGEDAAVRRQIAAAETERRGLRQSIDVRFPSYARIARPAAPTIAELRGALKPGEALVAVYLGDERSFSFAVPAQGPVTIATASIGRAAIVEAVEGIRSATVMGALGILSLEALDTAAIYDAIYAPLLKPLEPALANAKTLLIVGDGVLTQIPWSVLPTERTALKPAGLRYSEYRDMPWLLRKHALAYLPSAAALTALRREKSVARAPRAFVGIGDPVFRGAAEPPRRLEQVASLRTVDRRILLASLEALPDLPETRGELEQIARALGADPATDLYLGRRATESEVRRARLDQYRIVNFATHGLVAGDLPGLNQPALVLSSPAVASDGEDGLLTMGEVFNLRLAADWVVLSACNTAAAVEPGADVLSGLGSAFFYAGARSMLVTHWAVESEAAKALTTGVFKSSIAGRAEALQRATLALIDSGTAGSGRSGFSYAHPLFWAAFVLVGDPG